MINRIIEFSLRNRFLVIAFFILVIGAGIWAVKDTPIDAIPDIGENQTIVFTDWPGRSPKDVEDQITYPLSVNLQGLPGVKVVRSTSAFGFSIIYIIFEDNIDFYWARTRVLERLNLAQKFLPNGVVPILGPDATGLGQIFWYTVEGEGYGLDELRSLQDWYIRYQLNSVAGVSEVASVGGYIKQYQIDVDPNKLLAYNLKLGQVFNAVKKSNIDVGAKVVEENNMEFIVRGLGFIKSVEDVENIVLGVHHGVPIYVKNIANVQLGPDFRRGVLDKEGHEVTGGVVVMRYGENPLRVIEAVKQKIKELEAGLPKGVKIVPFYDRTGLIYRTIDTLKVALVLAIIITVFVIMLFLGHLWSTAIVSAILPIGILISFIIMYYLKIPSNIMSLSGIIIAIGTMVDAGIVMVENIMRHLAAARESKTEKGVLEITIDAAKEVGGPIFFSFVIIAMAVLPIFSLQGQEGKLFKPLAFTWVFAIAGAGFLSLTLVPILCSWFLRGKFKLPEENFITAKIVRYYEPALKWALVNKGKTILVAVTLLVVAVGLVPSIGNEFMPPFDEGSILFMPVALPSASLTQVKEILQKQNRIIKSFPEVRSVVGKSGRAETATDPAPVSMIETVINLKPKKEWRKGMTKDKLVQELDAALRFPGVSNIWTQPIVNRIDMLSTGIRTQIGVKIFGDDLARLQNIAQEIEMVLRDVPGAVDLYSEKIVGKPYLEFDIDRRAAARYGVKVGDVQQVIMTAIGGKNITTTVQGRERYPVRVRYMRELHDNISALKRVLIPTATGAQIPISQVADIRKVMGPAMINSENGLLRAFVLLNVRGRDPVGFVNEAAKVVAKKVKLPAGYFVSWSGQYENQIRAKARLQIVVPLALFIIFVLLYMKFKSFSTSALIIAALPFAFIGGILLQYILGYNFSVAVWVGFIALFGVAVEAGVVMVDFLNLLYRKGEDIHQAVVHAGKLRVRPILMTSATTILALIPVMFSTGTGAEVMRPMATPTVGGMITATFLNLIVVPVLFAWQKEREVKNETR